MGQYLNIEIQIAALLREWTGATSAFEPNPTTWFRTCGNADINRVFGELQPLLNAMKRLSKRQHDRSLQ